MKYEEDGGIHFESELNIGSTFHILVWNIEETDKIFNNSTSIHSNNTIVIIDKNIIVDRKSTRFLSFLN